MQCNILDMKACPLDFFAAPEDCYLEIGGSKPCETVDTSPVQQLPCYVRWRHLAEPVALVIWLRDLRGRWWNS